MDVITYAAAVAAAGGGGGSAASWEDIGGTVTVYWEYTEGYTPIESVTVTDGVYLYKVRSEPMTKDEIVGCSGDIYYDGTTVTGVVTEDMLTVTDDCIYTDTAISVLADSATMDGVTLTKGLWVMYSEAQYLSKLYKGNVTPIPAEYLPASAVMPTVTAEDNGKMLQVVSGAWAAVTITDGNEVAY